MDGPLYKLMVNCTVRLKMPGGTGTGFFVAPGFILTCAHNVKKAKDNAARITAHYGNEGYEVQAITYVSPDTHTDLALLRIELREHPCVYLDANVQPLDKLYTFGYTTKQSGGESTTVEYEGQRRIDDQQ